MQFFDGLPQGPFACEEAFLFSSTFPLLTNPAFCLMIDESVTQFLQNCKYSNKRYKMDTERWQILLKAIDRGSLRAAAEEMGFTVSEIGRAHV